jgi:hypothetical protein
MLPIRVVVLFCISLNPHHPVPCSARRGGDSDTFVARFSVDATAAS